MAFESFLSSINSTPLKAVALHWNAARGDRLMPSWGELRPAAMARQLPLIWSYRFDRSTGEFTGRLAGNRITEVSSRNASTGLSSAGGRAMGHRNAAESGFPSRHCS